MSRAAILRAGSDAPIAAEFRRAFAYLPRRPSNSSVTSRASSVAG